MKYINVLSHQPSRERLCLTLLIVAYLLVCCVSSIYTTQLYSMFYLVADPARRPGAMIAVAAFAPLLVVFAVAPFSFGYFIGFYFFCIVAGYLWFTVFSELNYDRWLAGFSAVLSIVAFLLPALFISRPMNHAGGLSVRAFDRLLTMLLVICLATVAFGASHNFRFAAPADVSNMREDSFPKYLNYLIGLTSSAVLPFLFACFAVRKDIWRAAIVLVVLSFYYPVAMTKVAFFAPAWLTLLAISVRIVGARVTVVLSLLLPALLGIILVFLANIDAIPASNAIPYFYTVNFRMIAIPSIAMDIYNDFFASHPLTHFCQIGLLKSVMNCPYQDQLSIVFLNHYPVGGNFNASLFATEGIASVGTKFAPLSVLVAGFIVALGNRTSSGLPPALILLSSAILSQILLNVPLSTTLVTHGAGLLFLLWYVTPRAIFQEQHG